MDINRDHDSLIADDPDTPETNIPAKHTPTVTSASNQPISVDITSLTYMIFNHAVKEFNAALPGFLNDTVDPSLQRKRLYDLMSQDIKDYLDALRLEIEHENAKRWEKEKIRLQANLREFEERVREFDNRRTDLTQKNLNTERQRRALAERVAELEEHARTLEAEKEQFEIECKGLVNKLKVASVFEEEATALRQELAEIRQNNPNSNSTAGSSDDLQKHKDLIEKIEGLEQHVRMAEEDKQKLSQQLSDAVAREQRSQSTINNLQDNLFKAESELAGVHAMRNENISLKNRIEQLESKIKEALPKYAKSDDPGPTVSATPIEDILNDTEPVIQSTSVKRGTTANSGNLRKTPNEKGKSNADKNQRGHDADSMMPSLF